MVLAGLVLLLSGGNAAAQESGDSGDSPSGGDTPTTPTTTGVVVNGSVYGGGNLAEVGGTVVVNIKAGTVAKDVYGGGALANTNTSNWDFDGGSEYEQVNVIVNETVVTGMYTKEGDTYTKITDNIKAAEGVNYYKKIGTWATTGINTTTGETTYTTTVNLLGGTINGDAYGGGLGRLPASVHYTQEEADAYNREHGLSSEDSGYKTTADWQPEVKATVYGDISVNLGSSAAETSATAFNINYYQDNANTNLDESTLVNSGRVFGGNNLNGSPQGNVTVTVYKTVKGNTDKTASDKLKSTNDGDHHYQVAAVYGGGNLSNYEPTTTGKKAHVIINGCSVASILTVYGGGNAAAVPETDVDIYGSYEIGAVFGGGNGKDPYTLDNGTTWATNPGANVNGNANTMLYGGLIHEAFGGSNEKGRITGNVSINTDPDGSECDLDVGTIYGAGKNADIDGDLIVTLGCMQKRTDAVYGGAENANVKGNVELTITSGEFGKVFGGNNQSGAIFGSITLNIMESGCSPIEIDELYLGGNQAAYSVYGYYKAQYYVNEGNYYLDANSKISLYAESGQLYLDNAHTKPLYQKTGETYLYLDEECTKPFYMPRTSADDSNPIETFADINEHTVPNTTVPNTSYKQYADPVLNIVSATKIGKVFGGGLGSGAAIYGNPTVNINQAYPLAYAGYNSGTTSYSVVTQETLGAIGGGYTYKDESDQDVTVEGGIYGGGNEAYVYGNTTVNIGTERTVDWKVLVLDGNQKPVLDANGKFKTQDITGQTNNVMGANIAGNVYGGGNQADVTGNTFVNVCAEKSGTTYNAVAEGSKKVTIAGNVFGGGKGVADNFLCDKAMVGTNDKGLEDNYTDGNTSVIIGNGTVNRNVYGGGEVGRVEMNTTVTVGLPGTVTSSPDIKGDVFGGGMGDKEHGYAGLVRGNPTVTIQANTKVEHNVYGGGEIASVARYKVPTTDEELAAAHNGGYPEAVMGRPYALKDPNSGFCTVTVQGNAVIGPDYAMEMTKAGGPDDAGHVFGAGKGIMPENYDYASETVEHKPRCRANNDEWTWFADIDEYIAFIQTLALSSQTTVNIGNVSDSNSKPFIKGSVYGGSENGLVQFDTNVYIKSGQIGCGKNTTKPHVEDYPTVWDDNFELPTDVDLECSSWDYGIEEGEGTNKKTIYAPYDPNANVSGNLDKYPSGESTEGGRKVASDGHTYYGNVFGGGSGSVPYFDTTEGISKYLHSAGTVKGNTNVTISGGHILTSVYGGCEATNVMGTANVTMTGGTIGVPRTDTQILAHPVTCNLFGAGKGDQRVFFNKDTNVNDAVVTVSGGRIYGSVFGGGEDGHIMRNSTVTISGANTKIGTKGTSYMDGNVFGGGRGFGGDALTAGNVGGAVTLNIENGYVLGSVYGGGRLASVGYGLYLTTETGYGEMRADDVWDDPNKPITSKQTAAEFFDKGRGKITINISGGTIGNDVANAEYGGNVFGGSMGSLTKQDGTLNTQWDKFATAKKTTVNVSGGTIKRSVYGGGELGTVTTDAVITVSGGTIGKPKEGTTVYGGAVYGNIYGGGKGYVDPDGSNYITAGIVKGNTKVTVENGTNTTPTIYHNIYGGGAYGSVGTFTYDENNNVITGYTSGGKAEIYIIGGTIGTDGKENGMIFGSSRGDIGRSGSIHDKLAWVYDTHVAIGDTATNATITTATPLIKGSVYGGGENGHNYRNAYVRINGGTIGIASGEQITDNNGTPDDTADDITYSGAEYPYRGNVYGGGCGTDKYYQNPDDETHDGNGQLYNPKAGIVQGNAIVHVTAGNIVRNVYGAGAMGSVGTMTKDNDNLVISSGGKTTIKISGGTIGVDGTDNGNVFGAARGDAISSQSGIAQVKETDVIVSGGTVKGNVYGGGEIGCVGTFGETDGKYVWSSGGLCKVTVSGGKIGPDGNNNPEIGNVFGAGKGKANTFKCEKAMVRETIVSISDGTVNGNVYGGGEIGRVEEDTEVTIGRKSGEEEGAGTGKPDIKGSVFGAGKGKETHGYSALVRGNTRVTVEGDDGAKVGVSVYGGGEIASVGRYGLDSKKMPEILVDGGYCYLKVLGKAEIGPESAPEDKGNVFGAGKGITPAYVYSTSNRENNSRRMVTYDPTGRHKTGQGTLWDPYDDPDNPNDNPNDLEHLQFVWEYFTGDATAGVSGEDEYKTYLETLALATHPEVTIGGTATVNGSVFGGGELGLTKGSVIVNIIGGTIVKDVYGGGSLANTNTTSTWAKRENGKPLPPDEHGNYTVDEEPVHPTTTVNLLGGHIMGDAYGGGLGDADHAPTVKGDVLVELNNNNNGGPAIGTQTGCIVNRVFGCNNLNGTPKKKVKVHVYATQRNGANLKLKDKAALNSNTYDVLAVYGGGNLSAYEPEDPDLTTTLNETTEKAEVIIEGCSLTSIKQVYGGGNAASVPATRVQVNSAYVIDEVFGGGNGDDPYTLNGETYVNPGANVGYYNYTHFVKNTTTGEYEPVDNTTPDCSTKEARVANYSYGTGVARLEVYGGTIHTSYGGSNAKGNIRVKASSLYSADGGCEMKVGKSYGGGKNAPIDGEVEMVADCAHGVEEMFGGSENADVDNDINLVITNGSTLRRVFGGNNTSGAINGSITVTIKESGCEPIRIGELYLGGYLAPYSVYGYEMEGDSYKTIEEQDEHGNTIYSRIPLEAPQAGVTPHKDPRIYVISATSIGNIYGGGYKAKLVGNPHINVNMEPGQVVLTQTLKENTDDQYIYKDAMGAVYDEYTEEGEGDSKKYIATLNLGEIGNIYGGGNMADIVGDTHVEIGSGKWHNDNDVLETEDADGKKWTYSGGTWTCGTTTSDTAPTPARYAANITGNVYGGGNQADVTGNTYVDICAYEDDDTNTADVIEYKGVAINDSGQESVTIGGNVFGGGKGIADSFRCAKAMVGVENTNNGSVDITTEVTSDGTSKGTRVSIGNGTVEGAVYGGGQIGRVEWNTVVKIGLPVESGKSKPVIGQNVFGAGKGVEQYGYAALVRGNTFVTIQADAKVGHSVYGGGEIASVGKYNVVGGVPTSLANQGSGYCNVTVKGNAEIGPDDMQMYHVDSNGNIPADDKPDDWGHVFGAGKGILPYEDKEHFECKNPAHQDSEGHGQKHPGAMKPGPDPISPNDDEWVCYEGNEAGYLEFVETQALATQTEVVIGGSAFVKGSVYGGSENGHVQHGTHVTIEGDCQIGAGFDTLTKKSKAKYTGWPTETENISDSWAECAHWDYDPSSGAPYDKYAIYERDGKSYYYDSNITTYHNDDDGKDYADEAYTLPVYAEGGAKIAKDGHTYYGNVFGGGSGSIPYAPGKWHRAAGSVGGNTVVDITGGHILTSVYGGNEQTDVGTYKKDNNGNITTTPEDEDEAKGLPGGKCTVNMMGGTVGVPRTEADAKAHPVTCYLFGAGKGDQRIFFNTWTNVINTEVNISGDARIYGSTFGGGEDGHIINNAVTNIGGTMTIGGKNYTPTNKLIIGTTGTSYVDGNVFGGGRGFSGDAQTAGTVGGNIEVNIYNGKMLGSIYGGGRLASVGTQFTSPTDPNYGDFLEDGNGKSYGHVIVNIGGGTIGRDFVKDDAGNLPAGAEHSGNVFGGSMGRLDLLDGTRNPIWPKMAQVKTSAVNVYGSAEIKRNVFGGGELGTVRDNASVVIGGYLNPRVSDGCKSDFIFNPSKSDSTITVSASANAPIVYRDVYGGGYGSQDFETKTKITVKMPKDGVTNPTSASDYDDVSYVFTPMIFAGDVGQHTFVNIAGGMVRKSVYGGGEMASVGILDCRVDENGNYINVHSHLEGDDGFALSWPYHFENAQGYFGATHVKVTGGRIGVADGDDDINTDNGDVYGGGKGIAGDYKNYVFCANVGSTDVTIAYPASNNAKPETYMSSETIECIAGAVYGGAENGHVMGDANLTIENGLIGHSVYGGGSGKGKFTDWLTKIPEDRRTVVTSGGSGTPPETNESGEYKAECYSITAGKVFGNITLEMKGGYVVRNVYGGGNMGSVGKGNYSGGADDYSKAGYGETLTGNLWDGGSRFSQAFLSSGKCTVKITGGTVGYIGYDANDPLKYVYPRDYNTGLPYGNVFGGCRGESAPNILEHPRYLYCPEFFLGYVNETDVTIGKEDGNGPTILGSVYGGGMDGHVRRDTKVTINGGEIGSEYTPEECAKVGTSDLNNIMWLHRGNVYGAGSGIGKYKYDFNYDGDFGDVIDYKRPGATTATRMKEEDYSTSAGSVTRFTKVEVKGGKIHRNVYGGGSLSSIGGPKIPPITDDPIHRDDSAPTTQGLQSQNEVIISGSTTTIGDATSYDNNGNHVYGGFVFGASRGDETLSNPTSFASSVWTDVKVQGGTIYGDVYGGGEVGTVRQGAEVQLTGGVIGSVKGGEVVGGDVFGGGKGTSTVAADVGGDVLVELNKGVAKTDPGCVVDRIFGANNINGTPKGHVTVHVYATQNRDLAKIEDKKNVTSPEPPASDFDMTGVFGGGKSSDYVPAESDTKQSTEVIIEGCKLTSIYEVYGGGYGASTPGTNVLINGTKIIDKVFGGGYGKSTTDFPDNPGANIGYRTVGKTPYGSHINDEEKIAIVQLNAGKVNSVFGGSNTLGDIRNGASITTLTSDDAEEGTGDPCDILEVGELYGGGNEAVMEGGAEIVLRCMPDSWIGEVYAGARKADVGNDVSLTITSGKFKQVFGGNKSEGKIDGYVEVNIEECPTCNTPVIIGELYGGGNEAPYKYSKIESDPDYPSPRVNVRAFTSIGTIYGGGKGENAVVKGNPTVNVSVGMVDGGGQDYSGETRTVDGKDIQLYGHEKGKIGVIGDIFGGGNAAEVDGNTNVFIGTEKYVKLDRIVAGETDVSNYYIRTGTSSNYEYTPVPRTKATAGVTYYQRNPSGTYTEVSVEAGADVSGYYTRSGEEGSYVYTPVNAAEEGKVYCLRVEGVDIRGNVYGGGNAAKVTGNTNVVVGKKTEE